MNYTILPRSWAGPLLSVVRIVIGLLFLEHGTGKLLGFPHPSMPGNTGMLTFTGAMELVGGVLITLGLFTRPAAFVLSGYMAAAYFIAPFPAKLLSGAQQRRGRGALLLRLPLSRRRRPGTLVDRPGLKLLLSPAQVRVRRGGRGPGRTPRYGAPQSGYARGPAARRRSRLRLRLRVGRWDRHRRQRRRQVGGALEQRIPIVGRRRRHFGEGEHAGRRGQRLPR